MSQKRAYQFSKSLVVADFTDSTNVTNKYIPVAESTRGAGETIFVNHLTAKTIVALDDGSMERLFIAIRLNDTSSSSPTEYILRFALGDGDDIQDINYVSNRFLKGTWSQLRSELNQFDDIDLVLVHIPFSLTGERASDSDLLDLPVPTVGQIDLAINVWEGVGRTGVPLTIL